MYKRHMFQHISLTHIFQHISLTQGQIGINMVWGPFSCPSFFVLLFVCLSPHTSPGPKFPSFQKDLGEYGQPCVTLCCSLLMLKNDCDNDVGVGGVFPTCSKHSKARSGKASIEVTKKDHQPTTKRTRQKKRTLSKGQRGVGVPFSVLWACPIERRGSFPTICRQAQDCGMISIFPVLCPALQTDLKTSSVLMQSRQSQCQWCIKILLQ